MSEHANPRQAEEFQGVLVQMHAALNKKVDDEFRDLKHDLSDLNAKFDAVSTALLGCLEDGTPGLIAKVGAHDRIVAKMIEEETIEKVKRHDEFMKRIGKREQAFILCFVAAIVTGLVTFCGAAIWAGFKVMK